MARDYRWSTAAGKGFSGSLRVSGGLPDWGVGGGALGAVDTGFSELFRCGSETIRGEQILSWVLGG